MRGVIWAARIIKYARAKILFGKSDENQIFSESWMKELHFKTQSQNKLISITTNEDNDLKTNCESQCVEKKNRIECVHKANVVFMKKKNLPTDQYSES